MLKINLNPESEWADHDEKDDNLFYHDLPSEEEQKCAQNDMLRNASTGMMSWAEKNFKMKLIDNLYHMRYYKYNQTIYLNSKKGEK